MKSLFSSARLHIPLTSLAAAIGIVAGGSFLNAQDAASQNAVYRIAPFDLVSVTVYGEDDLASEQRVSDNGRLSIPLIGETAVGGMTISQASKQIERAFIDQEFLRSPIVTVSVKEFAPKVASVLGEVENPGSVEIPPGRNGLPLAMVIAGSGGFTGTAKVTQVRVTRDKKGPDGQPVVEEFNMDKIVSATSEKGEVLIYPDDVVVVPRRVF